MKILLCTESDEYVLDYLAPELLGHQLITSSGKNIEEKLDDVDVVIPWYANIDASTINSGKFGLVQQFGVGLETVDIEAATHSGVHVARVPGGISCNADSVAEHAIMLMLILSRRIEKTQQTFNFESSSKKISSTLFRRTACIIGLGDIGIALASRLHAFGVRIIAVRQHPDRDAPTEAGVEEVYGLNALPQALSVADYVIVCANYNRSTHHLINKDTLAAMKPEAYLINVARGGLVDTNALASSLEKGDLAGAGLDVVETPTESLRQNNVIITPHIAGMTDLSYLSITAFVVDNIERYGRGEQLLYTVNKPKNPRRNVLALC